MTNMQMKPKFWTEDQITQLEQETYQFKAHYTDLMMEIWKASEILKRGQAKEFLWHGIARRLGIIQRCLENIFRIFPIRQEKALKKDALWDVTINLHTFLINIFGVFDNMAWTIVHEKNIKIKRNKVGLFKKEMKNSYDLEFREYLDSDRISNWYKKYFINYRHAISHQIPLYIPPKHIHEEQNDQERTILKKMFEASVNKCFEEHDILKRELDEIGEPCFLFIHALSENKYVVLHPQVIADFKTLKEILEKYLAMLGRINCSSN